MSEKEIAGVPTPEAVERAMVKVIDTSADVVCASDEWTTENDAQFKWLLKRAKDAQVELRATVQQYGDAREAAGYARGRAEAGRDAECQRRLFDVLLGEDGQAWKEAERYLETARPDLYVALRGEVK